MALQGKTFSLPEPQKRKRPERMTLEPLSRISSSSLYSRKPLPELPQASQSALERENN